MPAIIRAQKDALTAYQKAIAVYIASWRTTLLKNNSRERTIIADILNSSTSGTEEFEKEKHAIERKFNNDIARIQQIKEKINSII